GHRVLEHDVGEPGELGHRLALGPQRDEEAGELDGTGQARHHLVHRPAGLRGAEVLPGDEGGDEVRPRGLDRLDPLHRHRRPPERSSPATASWISTGSIGAWTIASACAHVASHASCGRAVRMTTGGHLYISLFSSRLTAMPPALAASPSSTMRAKSPSLAFITTPSCVAASVHRIRGTSTAARRPMARRTCSRVVTSSL